ncbi:hypothetical protein KFE98_16885 [bacterium SCSIO 12741]|nr:hypothetical protein KFE98_16885 [bacterium SCSIO 12741]
MSENRIEYDLTYLSDSERREIALEIYNHSEDAHAELNSETGGPDLFERDEVLDYYMVAKIYGDKDISVQEIRETADHYIDSYKPSRYVIFYFDEIHGDKELEIANYLTNIRGIELQQFSPVWIQHTLNDAPQIAQKFNLKSRGYPGNEFLVNINKDFLIQKYSSFVQSQEYYFEKAREALKRCMPHEDTSSGFAGFIDLQAAIENPTIEQYAELKVLWKSRGDLSPTGFELFLDEKNSSLSTLYRKINTLIAYADTNGLHKQEFNLYKDKRAIAKIGPRQHHLIPHFIDYALDGFKSTSKTKHRAFNQILDYLNDPIKRFNIASKPHREKIFNYFIGTKFSENDFHIKLKEYFDQFDFLVTNPENVTAFYTRIIYDPTFKKLWLGSTIPRRRLSKSNEEDEGIDTNGEQELDRRENIPFHLDQVEEVDRLNRDRIAKSLTGLLNNQIFNSKGASKDKDHSFMIHLQGAWGDGKSTFLKLIEKNLDTEENKWIVIHFNAWQHQHVNPPWWPFLDQIYNQAIGGMKGYSKAKMFGFESLRRLFNPKFVYRSLSFLGFVLLIYLMYIFFPEIMSWASEGLKSPLKSHPNSENLIYFSKIVGSMTAIGGVLYTLSQFVIRPVFIKSPDTAKSFMQNVHDPMMKIKKHFESLIKNIEQSGYHTAIFIDDIDRCNSTFAVELLEGIQTLYKEKKVLYIVAGDKHWISTCFENHYKDFTGIVREPGHRLGYFFIEKAFQLSVRLPQVTGSTKEEYWNFILDPQGKYKQKEEVKEAIEMTDELKDEIKSFAKKEIKKDSLKPSQQTKNVQEKFGISMADAKNALFESLDEDTEELGHLFQNHHDLIEANPRSIKRLANQYSMYRNILWEEDINPDIDKLFRWIILQNNYPIYTDTVERDSTLYTSEGLPKELEGLKSNEHWKMLVNDPDDKKGGSLIWADVAQFLGKETN